MPTLAWQSAPHWRRTRRFLVLIGALFATAFLIAGAAVIGIAQGLDRDEIRQGRFYAQKALDIRAANNRTTALSYAVRDGAYQHLVGHIDRAWAYEQNNLGTGMFTQAGFDAVFVIDDQGTQYALYRGQPSARELPAMPDLLSEARAAAPRKQAATRLGLVYGWPALITGAVIQPAGNSAVPTGEGSTVLVLADQLTPAKLLEIGNGYGLAELRLEPGSDSGKGAQLPLPGTGYHLAWTPVAPGAQLLWTVLPSLLAVAAVLALLLGYCFRFVLRASKQIDASFTSLRQSTDALEASEERFRAVAEAASDWIWETDARGRLAYLSNRFAAVTGFAADAWLGRPIEQLLSCDTTPIGPWLATLPDAPATVSNLRCAYRDHSGALRYCRVSARPIVARGNISGFRGTASDITDEVAAHARIQHLSLHDALTGLPNRNLLLRYLEDALTAGQHGPALTLLLVDLDHFKPINDSLGHAAGDAVLMEAGQRLKACSRDLDLVARLGGDEFVLVLCGLEQRFEVDRFCQRLIDSVQQPIEHEGHVLQVGASIGIAQSRLQGYDGHELIRCADIALYQAKASGKGGWRYFAEQMSAQIQHRRQLESELRLAVKNNEFVLHYQPRYQVDRLRIVAVEALVRWNHPVDGLLGPDVFIPLAEQTDLIVPLGRWVLREACETALQWPDALLVSVNLSPAQFLRSDVVADIRDTLVQTGFPARRLELEITENMMLGDIDNALGTLQALKELGVRLNMDDFGTGYSSLGYLRTYPFDSIKIDKRFICAMDGTSGGGDRAVVQAIINLARAMGLKVTAEGVETEQQLAALIKDRCHEVQGFYLSRPVDKAALSILLAQHEVAAANENLRIGRKRRPH
ncbi:EAL domain-containing protein [Pseudomonas typographi]|uniref:bifunctional diguanylate cyclase/phosphodiesterase n=1 Tax=Pseudomonas typographi TaxID=2715964 RepID=UPI0016836E31|nr:EAL domain-containing protein [Pseudomonas typographi]MBD1550693.1 EAL domain-containing protein [Pseudomonas typographi]